MSSKQAYYGKNNILHNTHTRIVTVYGKRATSYVIFFARYLCELGKYVLVIDNSDEDELTEYIVQMPDDEGNVFFKGVVFTKDKSYDKQIFQRYDVVLVFCGLYRDVGMEQMSDRIYLYTDFQKHLAYKVMGLARQISMPFTIIYTDCVKSDFAQSGYMELLLQESRQKIEERYFLRLSEKDYACGLAMQYTGRFSLQDFSLEHQELLSNMAQSLFPEYKQTRKEKKQGKKEREVLRTV